ncbi:MAG: hypothetical protein LQ347_005830, partial [Umbilicaria vellea]
GTVGCVVLDQYGTLCVATSTGGLTNKLPGRIGDTPTLGAGFWAEQWDEPVERPFRQRSPASSLLAMLPLGLRQAIEDCVPGLAGYVGLSQDLALEEEKNGSSSVRAVAMSGTGNGDSFLRIAGVRTAAAIARFSPCRSLSSAVTQIAGSGGELEQSAGDRWHKTGEGEGGIIGIELVNGIGKIVFDFNCGGMFRTWVDDDGVERVMPIENKAAKGISYFTPAQDPPAGTASDPQPDGSHPPKLFQPLKLRGVTLQNRIMLSPLCQYSAEDGHHTAWHMTHLGGIIQRGPGLSMVEATAVTPEGRITPEDSGLWKDSQIAPLKQIVEFAHSQNQNIGIQIAHAGRKASTVAPWLRAGDLASEEVHGWPDKVYGPSPIPWNEKHASPIEMTKSDIEEFKKAWVASVKRALTAGFDVIEIHNAHGYLLHSFISPASNQRTDEYGGSFENRIRLTLEIVDLTRQTVPKDMPVFLRISATDWLEQQEDMESWKVEDTVRLAEILADRGIDLLDVSSGGNHPLQHPHTGPGYQAVGATRRFQPFAKAVKKKVGDRLAVGTVGTITTGKQANELLEEGLDLAIVGRMFQKNPSLVWTFAEELGVEINVANQIRWGFGGRPGAPKEKKEKGNGKL